MIEFNLSMILHIVGDFYTQSERLSELKVTSTKHLLIHVLVYTLPFTVLVYLMTNLQISLLSSLLIFSTHYLTDHFKIKHEKKHCVNYRIFLIDQAAHIFVIYILNLALNSQSMITLDFLYEFLNISGVNFNLDYLLNILVISLLIYKPTAIFIKLFLSPLSHPFDNDSKAIKNTGEIIGILERFTIVLLGLMNQWSSIALVITAKSIARFKQLEDRDFAEKYLIGTLLSVSITLLLLYLYFFK